MRAVIDELGAEMLVRAVEVEPKGFTARGPTAERIKCIPQALNGK
jgi:hypothetical protein